MSNKPDKSLQIKDRHNGRIGFFVGEDNWAFFSEIFSDLSNHYQTEVFKRKIYNTPLLYGRLNRWAFSRNIQVLLNRNDICFFEWASELLAMASQMPKTCKIVTRLHSFELYQWAPKINWDVVDKVILVSQAMRDKFVDLYPDHIHKTEVVYNGISLERFKPPVQRKFAFNLGMLCNINPVKRIYEVILMFYNLIEQGYDAHLYIAGRPTDDFRYAVSVCRLVEKLNLQNCVIFNGHVADTPAWLEQIDIFISNSYWEGQPVALLEAMATGCYCLSHHWDGAEEVLPQENLYLTEAELLRKIIEYSAKSDSEKRNCRTNLRALAHEKFDIQQAKRQIRKIIEAVDTRTL
jgi:glycosyltransferase involved in cell wall biosynthesis